MDPNICVELGTVDCRSAGRLLASILDLKAENVPYMYVWEFYGYSGCLKEDDSFGNVLQSYESWTSRASINDSLISDFMYAVTGNATCHIELCKALDFTGNPDFAGIGVLVAFCIQLSIATCFAILYLYLFFRQSEAEWRLFRGTFDTFFISTVFFNFAIGLAATSTIIRVDSSTYTAVFVPLGCLLSLASTQAMWALYKHSIRPAQGSDYTTTMKATPSTLPHTKANNGTRLLRLCIAVLWINLLAIYVVAIMTNWASMFDIFCFHRLVGRQLADTLMYTQMALIPLGLICAALKMKFLRGKRNKRWRWLGPTTTILGIVIMWVAFGTFWVVRTQLSSITGSEYNDNDWGFGQIAAVAALFPTVVDIVKDSLKLLKGNSQADDQEGSRKKAQEVDQNEDEDVDEEEDRGDVGEETEILDARV